MRIFRLAVAAIVAVSAATAAFAQTGGEPAGPAATQRLFAAVNQGNMTEVRLSVAAGADLSAENDLGQRPVDLAVDLGHFAIAHYLLGMRRDRKPAQALPVSPSPPADFSEPAPAVEAKSEPSVPASEAAVTTTAPEPRPPQPTAGAAAADQPETAESVAAPPIASPPAAEPPGRPASVEPAPASEKDAHAGTLPGPPTAPPSTGEPGIVDRVAEWLGGPRDAESADEDESSVEVAETVEPEADDPVRSGPAAEKHALAAFEVTADDGTAVEEDESDPAPSDEPGLFERIGRLLSPDESPAETTDTIETAEATETAAPLAEPEAVPEPTVTETAETSDQSEAASPVTEGAESVTDEPGWFERLAGLLSSEENEAGRAEAVGVAEVSETTNETNGETAEAARDEPKETAAVTEGEPEETGVPSAVATEGERETDDDRFSLGGSMTLGRIRPSAQAGTRTCVDKSAWQATFCIEPLDWPDTVAGAFDVSSALYRGEKAIVHYAAGAAAQYHVLFKAEAFDKVAAYLEDRYGPPSAKPDRWTSLVGKPKRFNRTMRWMRASAAGGGDVLEIREIDDLRWSAPPDTDNGVLWLTREGSRPMFQYLSATDFLLVGIRAGAD